MPIPTESPALRWPADGLLPVIVQDAADGRVLMLAYTNAEALALTLETGEVHFFSRSRSRLWRKGETSGNVLHLHDLAVDCDADTLLATVAPVGPTCHRGTRSCFDADGRPWPASNAPVPTAASSLTATPALAAAPAPDGFAWLETLWATIVERAATRPEGSYTARLLAAGVDGPARKVAEEATEVLMAAKDDAVAERDRAPRSGTLDALAGEVADLLYHTLVLLSERGLAPSAVIGRLRERHAP